MLSAFRSPGSVGNFAGTAVVRTCAGDRKVEIYDMFHTPGTYMPPTGFVAMAHDTYTFNIFSFRRKVETSTYERDEFSRQRPLWQLSQTIVLRQGARPLSPAGQPNGCPVGCKVNTYFTATTTPFESIEDRGRPEIFRGFVCRNMRFAIGDVSWLKFHTKRKLLLAVAVGGCRGYEPLVQSTSSCRR